MHDGASANQNNGPLVTFPHHHGVLQFHNY